MRTSLPRRGADVKVVLRVAGRELNRKLVHCARVVEIGPRVAAVTIDLTEKRMEVAATGSDEYVPLVDIDARPGAITELLFPQFKGWDVWCAHVQKYHLAICFIKRERS
ncbi:MAG: hypothetical protein ABFE07_28325 [Armatimonadia bacterium]